MSGPPRVRFAPSPTGFLHVGSARAALFNWLYARHTGGTFILRIEDTDEARSRPELIEAVLEPLRTLGLDWDEGPYYQSQRRDLYAAAVDRLLEGGHAYRCDCGQDEVRARLEAVGRSGGYDGHCRDRGVPEGPGVVVRFRVPDEGETVVDDVIRGRVTFAHDQLEDFVVRRADGSTVFLLANAVDDADMGITHAVRGEDLLNTTPKVVLVLEALGLGPGPVYAHLPLLVNAQRKKLSKRRDDVALGEYLARGYLPEAMVNYLALLGWGPPDGVEIRPVAELVELFRLEDVTKAPAFFDLDKLRHFNEVYLRALDPDTFVERSRPWITGDVPWSAETFDVDAYRDLAPEIQARISTFDEIPDLVSWIFTDPVEIDDDAWAKGLVKAKRAHEVLAGVEAAFADCDWDAETLGAVVRSVGDDLGVKSQVPVRVAVTGRRAGLPLFEPLVVLGRDRARARLAEARTRLGGVNGP